MKKVILTIAALVGLGAIAWAVQIEGVTPSGSIKAVKVTNDGRFMVDSTSSTATHVIVDGGQISITSGSITVTSGTVTAVQDPAGPAYRVTPVGILTLAVAPSTCSVQLFGQTPVPAGGTATIYPVSVNRLQGFFCNLSPSASVWFGGAGVNAGTGTELTAGGCASPDVPGVFIGGMIAFATATANTSYWYCNK